ncbi:MAG TPA: DUF6537 domain-containing protein, partial [Aquabacterium sp.]|nr:DUF6537 domain-containing protein [Aquabacterium sp.]
EPLETEFGRKRTINQSTCNKDTSCLKGFCPSFVTVEGGSLKKPKKEKKGSLDGLPPIPEPALPLAEQAWGIVVAGVGGTGVITIGQLLGMAAHIEGKGVVTQDAGGLAQKGGATWSHIQIADRADLLHTTRVPTAQADLIVGCDPIVTALPATLSTTLNGRTHVALNTHGAPTAAFVQNTQWQFPASSCDQVIDAAVGADQVGRLDAHQLAEGLLGDAIYANPLMLGYAWQRGWVPLSRASLRRAIELNEVQIANNLAAFEWGRRAAHDLASVRALAVPAQTITFMPRERADLEALVTRYSQALIDYQDMGYALRYRDIVRRVAASEQPLGSSALTETVARQLFRLMAYKDEYEVARLLTLPAFEAQLRADFEGPARHVYHLAPPLWPRLDAQGQVIKQRYGPWMGWVLRGIKHLKGLRGHWLDPFGHTAERRAERALIQRYLDTLDELLLGLNAERLPQAIEIARIPDSIKGYGHIKHARMVDAQARWDLLMRQWRDG